MSELYFKETRQMGITHKDFFRLLPRAMGKNYHTVSDTSVLGELTEGTISISVGPEMERKLSALVIMPYTDITFEFHGVPDSVRTEFERHFHLRYMRGLG